MKFTRISILSLWLRATHSQQKKSPSLFQLPVKAKREPISSRACQQISACEPWLFKNPNDQTNVCLCLRCLSPSPSRHWNDRSLRLDCPCPSIPPSPTPQPQPPTPRVRTELLKLTAALIVSSFTHCPSH